MSRYSHIVSQGTTEVAVILPSDVGECIKSGWIPPQLDLCCHPDHQQLILGDFGSLTWLHQWISLNSCLIYYWYPRGYSWSSNFSDRSSEWKCKAKKKSFAYKEGLKWSHSNKLNSGDFSNWGKKICRKSAVLGKTQIVSNTLSALLEIWTTSNSNTWLLADLKIGILS